MPLLNLKNTGNTHRVCEGAVRFNAYIKWSDERTPYGLRARGPRARLSEATLRLHDARYTLHPLDEARVRDLTAGGKVWHRATRGKVPIHYATGHGGRGSTAHGVGDTFRRIHRTQRPATHHKTRCQLTASAAGSAHGAAAAGFNIFWPCSGPVLAPASSTTQTAP